MSKIIESILAKWEREDKRRAQQWNLVIKALGGKGIAKMSPLGSQVHSKKPLGEEKIRITTKAGTTLEIGGPEPMRSNETAAQDPDMYPGINNLDGGITKDAEDSNEPRSGIDMQRIIEGMDWEMSNGAISPEEAFETAKDCLEDDPTHYAKLRAHEDSTDDKLAKDTSQNDEDPFANEGYNLDLGSGAFREPGHIGVDLYPHDFGTMVHDLHQGLPFPDQSCDSIRMSNSLEHMDELKDNPTPLLMEIHRVLKPGGKFTYQGPRDIYDEDRFKSDLPGLVLTNHETNVDKENLADGEVHHQEFTQTAMPDPATAEDAEPRLPASGYSASPFDMAVSADVQSNQWSDATSSGKGNRLHGYPSQGALAAKGWQKGRKTSVTGVRGAREHDPVNLNNLIASFQTFIEEEMHEKAVSKGGPGSGTNPGSGEKHPHPGKLKDKEFKEKDKAVEAAGNRFDRNPTVANERAFHEAHAAREAHIQSHPETKDHLNRLNAHMNEKWGGNRPMYKSMDVELAKAAIMKENLLGESDVPGCHHSIVGKFSDAEEREAAFEREVSKDWITINGTHIDPDKGLGPKAVHDSIGSKSKGGHGGGGHGAKGGKHDGKHKGHGKHKGGHGEKTSIGELMAEGVEAAGEASEKSYHVSKGLKDSKVVPILKANAQKQIVYGVILAPNEVDSQEDIMEPEEIEKAAHRYLAKSRVIGSQHMKQIHEAYPVESYIAPQDFEWTGQYGPQSVKKGSWILGVKIENPDEWQKVLNGEYTGFSVGGLGKRDHI